MDTKKTFVIKCFALRAQNMIAILDSTTVIIERSIWSFKKHDNLHFDNE